MHQSRVHWSRGHPGAATGAGRPEPRRAGAERRAAGLVAPGAADACARRDQVAVDRARHERVRRIRGSPGVRRAISGRVALPGCGVPRGSVGPGAQASAGGRRRGPPGPRWADPAVPVPGGSAAEVHPHRANDAVLAVGDPDGSLMVSRTICAISRRSPAASWGSTSETQAGSARSIWPLLIFTVPCRRHRSGGLAAGGPGCRRTGRRGRCRSWRGASRRTRPHGPGLAGPAPGGRCRRPARCTGAGRVPVPEGHLAHVGAAMGADIGVYLHLSPFDNSEGLSHHRS